VTHDQIAAELVAMAAEDQRVRAELAADGSLFDGYHPRMEAVHVRNAARLVEIVDRIGWPTRPLVGEEASRAAWLILHHAIGNPDLQRQGLVWLTAAAVNGGVPPIEVAMLDDRIRVYEGRPQRYGTQFDWDEDRRLSPYPVEDPDRVDRWRAAVGLEPLAEAIRRCNESAEGPPADWAERDRQKHAWLRRVGWRV
jgi:hypothetical protein